MSLPSWAKSMPFPHWFAIHEEELREEYDMLEPLPACHYERWERCDTCDGIGAVFGEECTTCDGEGQIELTEKELFDEWARAEYWAQCIKDKLNVELCQSQMS